MPESCVPLASGTSSTATTVSSADGEFETTPGKGSGVGDSRTSGQVSPRDVFSGTNVTEPTEVLGVVDVHEPAMSDQQGLEIMRERAAAMHADAVVGVEFHGDDKSFTDLSGLAVRYDDLLRGRKYDVIEVIRVHEGEGNDGDAMGELKRRAKLLRASLSCHSTSMTRSAEKDGTYLSGTAIRYRND